MQAFTASVDVAANGHVGVTYYDFRKNTADPTVLLTSYWQVTSRNRGATWQEIPLAGPFDMRTAPVAGGFFLRDYEGLSHAGASFVPFFVMTNSKNPSNRTDVFAAVTPRAGRKSTDGAHRNPRMRAQASGMVAWR